MPKFSKYDKVRANPECKEALERLNEKVWIVQSSEEPNDYVMDGPRRRTVKSGFVWYHVLCKDTGQVDKVQEAWLELAQ